MNSQTKIDIYEIEDTYKPIDDIFSTDEHSVDKLKRIIYYYLNDTERRIILTYTELGNLRECAKLFNVSTTTIWTRIKDIQNKIILLYRNK